VSLKVTFVVLVSQALLLLPAVHAIIVSTYIMSRVKHTDTKNECQELLHETIHRKYNTVQFKLHIALYMC